MHSDDDIGEHLKCQAEIRRYRGHLRWEGDLREMRRMRGREKPGLRKDE